MLDKEVTIKLPTLFKINLVKLVIGFVVGMGVVYFFFTGVGYRYYFACAPTESLERKGINETPFFTRNSAGSWLAVIRVGEFGPRLHADVFRSDSYREVVWSTIFSTELPRDEDLGLLTAMSEMHLSPSIRMKAEEDGSILRIESDSSYLTIDKPTLVATEYISEEKILVQCASISKGAFDMFEEFSMWLRLEQRFYDTREELESFIREYEGEQRSKYNAINELKAIIDGDS